MRRTSSESVPKSSQLLLFEDDVRPPTLRDVADAVRLAGVDALPDARRRADDARYQEVRVRSALARATGMPFEWALNPYRGCTHACEYCYARKYQRHLELGAGDDFSSVIFVKINLIEVLQREVTRQNWTRESVSIGTATDPYQPIEGHYRLTRRSLEVLTAARTPFAIVTKGPMVLRDLDLLTTATTAAGCEVLLSVPTVDADAWARLEPGTAPPAQRLRAVRTLVDAGIDAGVLMSPLVPGITATRENIQKTVAALADAGAPFVGTNIAHLDPGVREHFMAFLAREYPQLVDGYGRHYARGAYAPREYANAVKAMVKDAVRRSSGSGAPSAPQCAARSADASRTAPPSREP
jgi:DNA repair photolyase